MRALQKLVARLDAGESIVVGAIGGSVTAAHGELQRESLQMRTALRVCTSGRLSSQVFSLSLSGAEHV